MNNHKRKMIAPIVVTVIIIAYYALYFGVLMSLLTGVWRVVVGVAPLIFSALTLGVCIERINEIKKGEEDDISKY
jgi:hypothetical protein